MLNSVALALLFIKLNLWLGGACCILAAIGKRNPFLTVALCRTVAIMSLATVVLSLTPPVWKTPIVDALPQLPPRGPLITANHTKNSARPLHIPDVLQARSDELASESNLHVPSPIPEIATQNVKQATTTQESVSRHEPESANADAEIRYSGEPALLNEISATLTEAISEPSVSKKTNRVGRPQDPASTNSRINLLIRQIPPRFNGITTSLLFAWAVVSVALTLRIFAMWLHGRKYVLQARQETQSPVLLSKRVEELVAANKIELRISNKVSAPCLVGILRPTVLIPRALADYDQEESHRLLQLAIVHEAIHATRLDLFWHVVMLSLRSIFWPIPWAWWMQRCHLFSCERICDELSVTFFGNRNQYRAELAQLAARMTDPFNSLAVLAMVKRPEVLERLDLLKSNAPPMRLGRRNKFGILSMVALCLAMATWGLSRPSAQAFDAPGASNEIPNVSVLSTNASVVEPMEEQQALTELADWEDSHFHLNESPILRTASEDTTITLTEEPTDPTKVVATIEAQEASTALGNVRLVLGDSAKTMRPPLPTSGVMRGRVLDEHGSPVQGAQIAVGAFETSSTRRVDSRKQSKSDAQGDWWWDIGQNPGVVELRVVRDGYFESRFPIRATEVPFETRLKPLYEFAGRVVDELQKPVPNARVYGRPIQTGLKQILLSSKWHSPGMFSKEKSNSEGRWFAHARENKLELYATGPSGEFGYLLGAIAGADHTIVVRPPKSIDLEVRSTDNRPIPNVVIKPLDALSNLMHANPISTSSNGHVQVNNVSRFTSIWMLEKPGMRTARISVREDQQEVHVAMHPAKNIEAQVLDDETGKPIPQCNVQFEFIRKPFELVASESIPQGGKRSDHAPYCDVEGVQAVRNGNLQLESNLDFEILNLTIEADEYQSMACAPIRVADANRVREYRLKKAQRTQVKDIDGSVAKNEEVHVYRYGDKYGKPSLQLRTDDTGFIRLPEITIPSTLLATENGFSILGRYPYVDDIPNQIELKPWGAIQIANHRKLQLDPSTLSWTIHGRNGSMFSMNTKLSRAQNGDLVAYKVAGDGPMVFLRAAIQAADQGQNPETISFGAPFTSGQTTHVVPFGERSVHGKIAFASSLSNEFIVSRASVQLTAESNGFMQFSQSRSCDEQGGFRFDHLPTGNYKGTVRWSVSDSLDISMRNDFTSSPKHNYQVSTFDFVLDKSSDQPMDLGTLVVPTKHPRDLGVVTISNNDVSDTFDGKESIAFVSKNIGETSYEVQFWSHDGQCVRTLNYPVQIPSLYALSMCRVFVPKNGSKFYVSSEKDVREFSFQGLETRRNTWPEGHLAYYLGGRENSLWVGLQSGDGTRRMHQLFSDQPSNLVCDSNPPWNATYSQTDRCFWSLHSIFPTKNLVRTSEDGTSTMLEGLWPGFTIRGETAAIVECDEGGCWTILPYNHRNRRCPFWGSLSRIESDGNVRYSKTLFDMRGVVSMGDKACVRFPNRLAVYDKDGKEIASLPTTTSWFGRSNVPDTVWARTGDDLVRIRRIGAQLTIDKRLSGIAGNDFCVVADQP